MSFSVIFDMNGTMIDDIPYHRIAWRAFFEKRGIEVSDEEFNRRLNGRTTHTTFEMVLERTISPEEGLELELEKETIYRELYAADRALVPGLSELIVELQEQGVPMAVATSAPPSNVSFILDHLKIRDWFGAVVDASDITNGKPDPEIFLTAAERIGSPAERCVVFEDSLLGVQAAHRAGMKAIAISSSHEVDELQVADRVIESFTQVSLEELDRLFG